MIRTAHQRSPAARFALFIHLAAVAVIPAACSTKGAWTEADELRSRVVELEKSLATTTAERNEARAKLAEIERASTIGSGDLAADVLDALPRCAGIELDRLSGLAPDASKLYVYLKPFDGRRRFVQIVGRVSLRADLLPEQPDAPPTTLASASLGPAELRDAYRSGLTGTHYELALPVDHADHPPVGRIAVRVTFDDALTRTAHHAEAFLQASKPPSRP